MSALRLVEQKSVLNALLAVLVVTVATAIAPVYAAPGEQRIVKDYVAATGWTHIVPLNVDGDGGLTDLLSYNATTGRAIVSIGIGGSGEQKIVRDYAATTGWTHIVPLNVDGDNGGLTDLLSYNATTGRAIVSIGIGGSGEQKIVREYTAAKGWTHIVPLNVDGDRLTDLLSYNATTGRAIVSIGIGGSGAQKIVRDYNAAAGWTHIVPLNVDRDFSLLTDLLSYNATTGRAIVSIGIGDSGEQKIVRDYPAAPGWTHIVPLDVDCGPGGPITDLLSYNATTGRAMVSVGNGALGEQKIVRDYTAATGWTHIVPLNVDGKWLTDLLSYNGMNGRAIVSVGDYCDPGPK